MIIAPRLSLDDLFKKNVESVNDKENTKDSNIENKHLELNDPDGSIDCWLYSRVEPINETIPCASIEELQTITLENTELLKQYKALIHYPGRVSKIQMGSLLDGHKLLMTHLHLMAIQGNNQEALNLWETNFSYWKKIYTSEPLTWSDKTVLLIVFSRSIELLPVIFNNSETFSKSDYQHLQQLLQPIDYANWNLEETIREEYRLMEKMIIEGLVIYPFLIKLNNRLMAKYYKEAQNFLIHAKQPSDQYCVMIHDRKSQFSETTTFQSIIRFLKLGPFTIYGLFSSPAPDFRLSVIGSMHTINTKMALASLFIHIKRQNLESSDIDIFIKNNLNISRDPRSNNTFKYNEEENKLFFEGFGNCMGGDEIHLTLPTILPKIHL